MKFGALVCYRCSCFVWPFANYVIVRYKKIGDSLRESEERYESVVENIGIGISVISPDMEILSLNSQMKKWFPDVDISKKPICYRAFNYPPKRKYLFLLSYL